MPKAAEPDKIPIDHARQLAGEVATLTSFLTKDETEHTWEQIDKSIKRFHAAVRGGACKFSDELVSALKQKEVVAGLVRSMNTERTRLSASTLDLLASLTRLGTAFAPLMPIYLPHILRLLCRTNKLYVSRATTTLTAIATKTKLASVLTYVVAEWKLEPGKSSSYRTGAIAVVAAMLGEDEQTMSDREGLDKRIEDLEWVIQAAAVDREPKVRAEAKKVWERYRTEWEDRVAAFTGPMTPITRRYLNVGGAPQQAAPAPLKPAVPKTRNAPKMPSALSSRPAVPSSAEAEKPAATLSRSVGPTHRDAPTLPKQGAQKSLCKSTGPAGSSSRSNTSAPVSPQKEPIATTSVTTTTAPAVPPILSHASNTTATAAHDKPVEARRPAHVRSQPAVEAAVSTRGAQPAAPIARARAGFRPTPSTAMSRSTAGPSRAIASQETAEPAPVPRRRAGRAVPTPPAVVPVPTTEQEALEKAVTTATVVAPTLSAKVAPVISAAPIVKPSKANDAAPARTGFRPKPPTSAFAPTASSLSKAKRALALPADTPAESKPATIAPSTTVQKVEGQQPTTTMTTRGQTTSLEKAKEDLARVLAKALSVPLPDEVDAAAQPSAPDVAGTIAEAEGSELPADDSAEAQEPLEEPLVSSESASEPESPDAAVQTTEERLDFLAAVDTATGAHDMPAGVDDLTVSTIANGSSEVSTVLGEPIGIDNMSATMLIVEEATIVAESAIEEEEGAQSELQMTAEQGEDEAPEVANLTSAPPVAPPQHDDVGLESANVKPEVIEEVDVEAEVDSTEPAERFESRTQAFFATGGRIAGPQAHIESDAPVTAIPRKTAGFFGTMHDPILPFSMRLDELRARDEQEREARVNYDEEDAQTCSMMLTSPPRLDARPAFNLRLAIPVAPALAQATPTVASPVLDRDEPESQELASPSPKSVQDPMQSSPAPALSDHTADQSVDAGNETIGSPLAARTTVPTPRKRASPSFYSSDLLFDDSSFEEEDEDDYAEGDVTAMEASYRDSRPSEATATTTHEEPEEDVVQAVEDDTVDYTAAMDFGGLALNDVSMLTGGNHDVSVDDTFAMDEEAPVLRRSLRSRTVEVNPTPSKASARSTRQRDVLFQIQ